jgi:aspartyl/glutamyl-tRNA(Asn/Gln) amidotransferase C subunit
MMMHLSKFHRCPRQFFFSTKSSSIKAIEVFFDAGPTWSLQELLSPNLNSNSSTYTTNDTTTYSAKIDKDQLEQLAELSHLNIPMDQRDNVIKDVESVLGMVSLVQEGAREWDESKVIEPIVKSTKLRSDKVTEPDFSKEILSNAAITESGYFVVPNTQERSGE